MKYIVTSIEVTYVYDFLSQLYYKQTMHINIIAASLDI